MPRRGPRTRLNGHSSRNLGGVAVRLIVVLSQSVPRRPKRSYSTPMLRLTGWQQRSSGVSAPSFRLGHGATVATACARRQTFESNRRDVTKPEVRCARVGGTLTSGPRRASAGVEVKRSCAIGYRGWWVDVKGRLHNCACGALAGRGPQPHNTCSCEGGTHLMMILHSDAQRQGRGALWQRRPNGSHVKLRGRGPRPEV